MADVRGLVGIDIGVLDDDLAGRYLGLPCGSFRLEQCLRISCPIEPDVDIAVACDFQGGDARQTRKTRAQFLSNLTRSPLQLSGELKRDRDGEFTEGALFRLFQRDLICEIEPVGQLPLHGGADSFFDFLKHSLSSMTNASDLKVMKKGNPGLKARIFLARRVKQWTSKITQLRHRRLAHAKSTVKVSSSFHRTADGQIAFGLVLVGRHGFDCGILDSAVLR